MTEGGRERADTPTARPPFIRLVILVIWAGFLVARGTIRLHRVFRKVGL